MPVHDIRLLQLCDGKLRTEDDFSFDVHRIVLAMKSEYFCAMFCGMNGDVREFAVPGISGKCLSEILTYVYTGAIRVTDENIADLLVAGDYLLIEGLHSQVKQSLTTSITVANCLKVFNTTCQIKDDFVYRCSFRFIETKFEEVMRAQTGDLVELPQVLVEKILSCRTLCIHSEATVWLAIKEWTQKNICMRLHCVPQFLMYLATKELDDDLATEIIEHEIVSKNPFMSDLSEYEHSPDFTSNLNAIVCFLEDRFKHSKHLGSYRIPSQLYVACSYSIDENTEDYLMCSLFITCNENNDLWRKIGESDGTSRQGFLVVVGHNLYLIGDINRDKCMKFDLIAQQWVPMSNYQTDFMLFSMRIVAVDGYIYIIGHEDMVIELGRLRMEIYDAANDRWFDGGSLTSEADSFNSSIFQPIPVVINKRIYVVGRSRNVNLFDMAAMTLDAMKAMMLATMTAMMFDTITQKWIILPSPRNSYRDRCQYSVVEYRGEVYMIGYDEEERRGKVEVLNPETNLWRELPDLPCTSPCTAAVVLNDRVIVYDSIHHTSEPEGFRWNDVNEQWQAVQVRVSRDDVWNHRFSIINDVNTIRHMRKENRDTRIPLEDSVFSRFFM